MERFRSNDSTHMADPIDRPQPNHRSQTNRQSLKYAFDAGFLSGARPSDAPDADGDSASRSSSDSESSDSDGESSGLDDLAASFRVVSEFAMRAERDELEMAKAREASRLAAEKRRAELEADLTRVVVRTQLQVAASCAPRASLGRKRKRSDEVHDSSSSPRERAMLLSLLQCNLI
ncbi:uncharacterized protein At4g22160 [Rhododendron vialii]|uniref:uncharacterized protein At4g22160 n=1 Tax=Rhododendron vialii TaxID=182163 RepID=UPI00265DD623|nr:uncharacterized protein At4g22160 [Rhododendron vialii]